MTKYLNPQTDSHDLCFKDFPKMEIHKGYPNYTHECPACFGHGGWNLQLNAYSLHDMEDTPENRHRYSHFRSHCSQCNGWGYVEPNSLDATCLHDYKEIGYDRCQELGVYHGGMCWHVYECTKCKRTMGVDSSD